MAENNEIKVKSLQKALEILNLFTEKPVLECQIYVNLVYHFH